MPNTSSGYLLVIKTDFGFPKEVYPFVILERKVIILFSSLLFWQVSLRYNKKERGHHAWQPPI